VNGSGTFPVILTALGSEEIGNRTREVRAPPREPNGLLARLAGNEKVEINSAHGQGIDQLGTGLVVEGVAPDGVIEALSLPSARAFTVGVQWHAEWLYESHPLSRALFAGAVHGTLEAVTRTRCAERWSKPRRAVALHNCKRTCRDNTSRRR